MPTVTNSTLVRLLDETGEATWCGSLSDFGAAQDPAVVDLDQIRIDLSVEGVHAGGGGAEPFWLLEVVPTAKVFVPSGFFTSAAEANAMANFIVHGPVLRSFRWRESDLHDGRFFPGRVRMSPKGTSRKTAA